jgi:thiamine-monophosphate kinase
MPGEFDFISWIRSQQRASDFVQLPAGDDLAILKWKPDDLLLVGVDQVLDGVHFDSSIHTPRQIGRKVMNRNLSDCAAMACLPAAAVVTVALPKGTSVEYAKELYLGMKEAGDLFDCEIVGGDTSSWDGKLVVTVSILGRSDGIQPLTRSGAQPGDSIYVTGTLGGSLLGRHMDFKPRINEARFLVANHRVTSMIDLSDGLSQDLSRLCSESHVGAEIDVESIPIVPSLHYRDRDLFERRYPPKGWRREYTPLEHALHDGEDYELLFTGSVPDVAIATRIGSVVAKPGITLCHADGRRNALQPKGWEHTF